MGGRDVLSPQWNGAEAALALRGVEHRYAEVGPRWSVPTWTLRPGHCALLVGPSGSGKTTLLELMAGIQTPRSGQAFAGGLPWSALTAHQRQAWRLAHFGMVFQGFELLASLRGIENAVLSARLLGQDRSAATRKAQALAERMGLRGLEARKPAQMSHGERQRVALIRALVHDPKVILADEPTANLDAYHTELVAQELRRRMEAGASLVVVTHDPGLQGLLEAQAQVWPMEEFRVDPAPAKAQPEAPRPEGARR